MTRSLEASYAPISSPPIILNVTGAATATLIASSAGATGVGGVLRRVRVANVGAALGAIVFAAGTAADAAITSQAIDATHGMQISPGTAETLMVSTGVRIGYVGVTDFSILISDV